MALNGSINENRRPLRILTIDNGGLQAISILSILRDVCEKLSKAEGRAHWKAPHELFDIIAGVGTGGWLAILLGRYKLSIGQCLAVYMNVASDVGPSRKRPDPKGGPQDPTVIDHHDLCDKIDRVISEVELGEFLVETDDEAETRDAPVYDANNRQCHAFALGVVKRPSEQSPREYRLFRAYDCPHHKGLLRGPDPKTCKVSKACAATAAARDFMNECRIGDTTYWDDTFPKTHNISTIALDEAAALYGSKPPMEFIVNISPGLPTTKEIDCLHQVARSLSWETEKKSRGIGSLLKKIKGAVAKSESPKGRTTDKTRSDTTLSTNTTSTTSTEVSEADRGHQKDIRNRLDQDYTNGSSLYYRIEMITTGNKPKPYLDDIYFPDRSTQLANEFLKRKEVREMINEIVRRCYPDWPNSPTMTTTTTNASQTSRPTIPSKPDLKLTMPTTSNSASLSPVETRKRGNSCASSMHSGNSRQMDVVIA